MSRPARIVDLSHCEVHQKLLYVSRKDARRIARRVPRCGQPRLQAYPCDVLVGYWHLGHLPEPVRQGVAGREDIWPARGVSR